MTSRFVVPNRGTDVQVDEEADKRPGEQGPPHAGYGKYLRNKQTGEIYTWNDRMALRGDILEAVNSRTEVRDSLPDELKALDFLSNPPVYAQPA